MEIRKWRIYITGALVCIFLSKFPLLYFGRPMFFFPSPFYVLIENVINIEPIFSIIIYLVICYIHYVEKVHLRTRWDLLLNITVTTCSLLWFSLNSSYGVSVQGYFYFYFCLVVNIIFISLFWIDYQKRIFRKSQKLILRTIFFIGYAFPFFGELI